MDQVSSQSTGNPDDRSGSDLPDARITRTSRTPRITAGLFILLLLIPFVAGLAPRLWNLQSQVMGDDELHAVRTALSKPVSDIWFYYQPNDHCIPLTVWYRWLIDRGRVMTEMDFRLPVLISGFLVLLIIPWALKRRLGATTAVLVAWLLALSPSMIFYSRIARSYMPIVLLGFAGVLSFEAWWRGKGKVWGLAYVFFSALAIYFHLGAGPFVIAPFLFAAGEMAWTRRLNRGSRPGFSSLVILGLALCAAMASFLVPARKTLAMLVSAKHEEQSIPLRFMLDVFQLQAGTAVTFMAILFWIGALVGLIVLLRRDPRFGCFSLTLVAGHLLGLRILSPYAMQIPIILNRYILPILPFVLLWVAVALARLWERGNGALWTTARRSLVSAFILSLALCGPFLGSVYRTNSFVHHNDFLWFTRPPATVPTSLVPHFYHQLAASADHRPVVEYPWTTNWPHGQVFYVYQLTHGQDVLVASLETVLNDSRLGMRNMPRTDGQSILDSRARYLVVHLELSREESRVMLMNRRTKPMPENLHERFDGAGRRLAQRLNGVWGFPLYSDQLIQVWDLDAIRARPQS